LASLLVGPSACSLVFFEPTPRQHRRMSYFSCTPGNVLPAVDSGLAVIGIAGTVAAIVDDRASGSGRRDQAIINGILAAAAGASAAYGFREAALCRSAQRELAQRLEEAPAQPPTYPYGYDPPVVAPNVPLRPTAPRTPAPSDALRSQTPGSPPPAAGQPIGAIPGTAGTGQAPAAPAPGQAPAAPGAAQPPAPGAGQPPARPFAPGVAPAAPSGTLPPPGPR
jgi:hypothetical protein